MTALPLRSTYGKGNPSMKASGARESTVAATFTGNVSDAPSGNSAGTANW